MGCMRRLTPGPASITTTTAHVVVVDGGGFRRPHSRCRWISLLRSRQSIGQPEVMSHSSAMSAAYVNPCRQENGGHGRSSSLYVPTNGYSNGQISLTGDLYANAHKVKWKGSLSEMGSFVLLLFSVVLLGSGSAILTTCFMSETSAASVIRSALLPVTHPLSILFYSLILSASVMCCTAVVIILSTCCCASPVSEKTYRTEMVLMNGLTEEPDSGMALTSELQSESLPKSHNGYRQRDVNGYTRNGGTSSQSNTHLNANGSSRRIRGQVLRNGRHGDEPVLVDEWNQSHGETVTRSSSPPSCFFCFLIFMLLFLLTIQLTVSFIGFVSSSSLQTLINDGNQTSFADSLFFRTSEAPADFLRKERTAFDKIEPLLRCCGLREYSDYGRDQPVPESCCKSPTAACGRRKHPSNIFYEGCSERIQQIVSDNLTTLSALSLGFSSVAAAGLFLSCYFYVRLISEHNNRSLI